MVFLLKRQNHSVFGIGESKAADNKFVPAQMKTVCRSYICFVVCFFFIFVVVVFFTSSSAINIDSSVVT